MEGIPGLLEGIGVLAVAFGGLLWLDRTAPAEPPRQRHPALPPRRLDDEGLPELERPEERESEIRDHLYGEAARVGPESGVLSTRRVPAGTRRGAADDLD